MCNQKSKWISICKNAIYTVIERLNSGYIEISIHHSCIQHKHKISITSSYLTYLFSWIIVYLHEKNTTSLSENSGWIQQALVCCKVLNMHYYKVSSENVQIYGEILI